MQVPIKKIYSFQLTRSSTPDKNRDRYAEDKYLEQKDKLIISQNHKQQTANYKQKHHLTNTAFPFLVITSPLYVTPSAIHTYPAGSCGLPL